MNRQKLVNAYAAAFKLHYEISRKQRGLVFDEKLRYYTLGDPDHPSLHLLETVLLGEENCTGDWVGDVARCLETTGDYVLGFMAGLEFAITPADRPE